MGKKEINVIQIRNEEIKLSLFSDDVIAYVENLKDFIKNYLDLTTQYSSPPLPMGIHLRPSVDA